MNAKKISEQLLRLKLDKSINLTTSEIQNMQLLILSVCLLLVAVVMLECGRFRLHCGNLWFP